MYNGRTSHEARLFVFEGTMNPTQHPTESYCCGLNVKQSMKGPCVRGLYPCGWCYFESFWKL